MKSEITGFCSESMDVGMVSISSIYALMLKEHVL